MHKKVIVNADETIVCPKCADKFPLDQGITRQTMEKYETEYESAFEKRKIALTDEIRSAEEKKAKKAVDDKEAEFNLRLAESEAACKKANDSAKKVLDETRSKLTQEFEAERTNLQQDLEQKEASIKSFKDQELNLRKEKQRIEQEKADLELNIQRRIDEERKSIQEQITKTETDKYQHREAAYKQKLADSQKEIEQITITEKEKAKKENEEQQLELQKKLTASEDARKKAEAASEKAVDETRLKLSEVFDEERKTLQQDLEQKEEAIKTFRAQELALRKEKLFVEQEKANLEIDVQRRLDEERKTIQEKTIKAEAEKYHLKEADIKKKLDDALKANEDLSRKLEQGSQQFQGEVLELELEAVLRASFPHDKIEPVKKGQRGADILHTVFTPSGQRCGTIIWEAKRAENWSDKWIQKLKDDQLESKAEIAAIVTTNMPLGIEEPFLHHENIWVMKDFVIKPVAQSLRIMLIEANSLKIVNTGKNEKMEALYNYLCSPQFSQRIRAVVDTFVGMKKDLDQEKNAFMKIWKKREVQIERVATNMTGMVGELEGISQESFQQLESVELLALPVETVENRI